MNVQTSYIIGALVLFTTLALIFNQKSNIDLETRLYHEAVVAAAELGDSFLNELYRLDFDETTVGSVVDTVTSLTVYNLLGPESGEDSLSHYDDIDDFDGYTKRDTLNILGEFITTVSVYYVDIDYPDTKSTSRHFYKRIDIEIDNDYLSDSLSLREPIKLFYITSY